MTGRRTTPRRAKRWRRCPGAGALREHAFVFAETYASFARSRAVRERIIADFWENPLLNQAEVTNADHRKAIALSRQHRDKSYPFCDAISFVVILRLGVRRVAAVDDHLRLFGGLDMVRWTTSNLARAQRTSPRAFEPQNHPADTGERRAGRIVQRGGV